MTEPTTPNLLAESGVDSEYSAANTLIHFDQPIPLLRGPIPAGPVDDPSSRGPYVLAFRDPQSFHSARRFCKSSLLEQCEAGTRIGCSIAASSKCRPPWWKLVLGLGGTDFKERERCEEREMKLCVEASKGKCEGFAEEKCEAALGRARVAVAVASDKWDEGMADDVVGLGELASFDSAKMACRVTNVRGNKLMGGGGVESDKK